MLTNFLWIQDTADLKLRIGLHSGPVVAGVLRGDRSRFQLFGDTVSNLEWIAIDKSKISNDKHALTLLSTDEHC
jgi:Adenylate and Guanylate cyclase catalytic domain